MLVHLRLTLLQCQSTATLLAPPPDVLYRLNCIAITKVDGRKSTRGLRAVVAKDSGEQRPKSSPSLAIQTDRRSDIEAGVFPGPTGKDAGMRVCIAMDGRIFLHPSTATFGPIAAIHFLNRNTPNVLVESTTWLESLAAHHMQLHVDVGSRDDNAHIRCNE
jgi:hypothetical protein